MSGRGALSFFVPTASDSLPLDIQPAATRAIRSILDEAYAEASRTLIANLETLRRLAAYLVEHERVDGPLFDELFDGRRAVPTAGDEWRAATSRPRAWGDVVDLAGHGTRPATPIAVAAVVASTAASRTTGADLSITVATSGSDLVRGSAGRWVRHAARLAPPGRAPDPTG